MKHTNDCQTVLKMHFSSINTPFWGVLKGGDIELWNRCQFFCIILFRMILITDWSIEKYYLKYVTITNLWQILSWSWRASPSLERMDCQVLKQNQHFKGRFSLTSGVVGVRGWWWWRGGRRSGIDLPVLTFHLAAALAIKLAEGRPEAGLPPHKLDRWLTIQPEIKDSELVVFIIKTS